MRRATSDGDPTAAHARRRLVALVVALVVVTMIGSVLGSRAVDAQQRTRFDGQVQRLDAALAERMTAYVQVLRGGLGLFASSDDVTRADWRSYVDTLQLAERYPGFKSLSYAPAVRTADLDAFVAGVRATGGASLSPSAAAVRDYELREPSSTGGEPGTHAPILYVAPDTAVNRRVLGVDMMLEPTRRATMQRAARSGQAVTSPRLLLSGSTNREAGFIIYVPVRKDGQLLGWLTAAFLADTFTRGLGDARGTDLDFEIFDAVGEKALLSSSENSGANGAPNRLPLSDDAAFQARSEVVVPGRTWEVRYRSADGFLPAWSRWVPWGIGLLGLLLIGVVLLLARAGERWRRMAVQLDEQAVVLRDARASAEATTVATSSFLATMSHEIRTPLNAVLGANSVLLETDLDAQQTQYVDVIREGGAHLLHVVNEVLDLSRAEAGKVLLEERSFDLAGCVGTVIDLVGPGARSSGVRLEVVTPSSVQVVGDESRLRQVLLNLVSNAVKFTETDGQVLVRAEWVDGLVEVAVSDSGIGIEKDRLADLFDPFVQAEASITRTHGGTGLGLAIAHRLVEAMGGALTVESVAGVGSTFRFVVPMPADEASDDATSGAADVVADAALDRAAPATAGSLRVLVAEDDPMSQQLLEHMVGILGHRVDVVSDGEAALTLLAGHAGAEVAVVLLDRHMPGVDGLETARRVHDLFEGTPRPRLIAISASIDDGEFAELVDDVIAKPFVLDDVARAFERVTTTPSPQGSPVGG